MDQQRRMKFALWAKLLVHSGRREVSILTKANQNAAVIEGINFLPEHRRSALSLCSCWFVSVPDFSIAAVLLNVTILYF
jgi:hypothetical protein